MISQLIPIEFTGNGVSCFFQNPAYLGLVNSRFHVVAITSMFNLVHPQIWSTWFDIQLWRVWLIHFLVLLYTKWQRH